MDNQQIKRWVIQEVNAGIGEIPTFDAIVNRKQSKLKKWRLIIFSLLLSSIMLGIWWLFSTKAVEEQESKPVANNHIHFEITIGEALFAQEEESFLFQSISDWKSPTDFLLP